MTIPLHSAPLQALKRPFWSWVSWNKCWLENKGKPIGEIMHCVHLCECEFCIWFRNFKLLNHCVWIWNHSLCEGIWVPLLSLNLHLKQVLWTWASLIMVSHSLNLWVHNWSLHESVESWCVHSCWFLWNSI